MVEYLTSSRYGLSKFKKQKGQQELHPENVIVINSKKQFMPYVKFNLNQLKGIANLMKLIHYGAGLI